MAARFDPLPPGTALGLFGLGVAVVTFVSLGADNVSAARTEWTARLSMVLAAPAIVLFVMDASGPWPSPWWRAYWTAGVVAYVLHVWWAVLRAFDGDIGAIIDRQGWVAGTNVLATILWLADVAAAWIVKPPPGRAIRILRILAWAIVTISFIVASAVFRTGLSAAFGYVLAALVAGALVARWLGLRPKAAGEVGSQTA